jgi:flagellar biosynthetic protein FlhB
VTAIAAVVATLAQTQLSFSWKKITPDFTRLGLRSGLGRILNTQSLFEAVKGTGKMLVVGLLTYSILAGEWKKVPGMMYIHVSRVWSYWGHVTQRLAWSVVAFAVALGVLDYLVNFLSLERKLRMTKEEVKEEYKKREFDPHLKARIRRMQREIASAKTIRATKTATVVITNPTHYAVALKYKRGLRAPVVVAKGVDSVALKMREIAKENQIPVVENPPLARTLYKVIEVGREIPETLWTAVSEIIKYVIRVKGWQFLQQQDEVS